MLPLADARRHTAARLGKLYDPREAELMADLLLSHLLQLQRHQLVLRAKEPLPGDLAKQLEAAVQRLERHEPLQYVLGEASFMGLTLKVGPGVLIPRPETEELVQWVANTVPPDSNILDIGTGSGCIALGLKSLMPKADVTGWDLSPDALAYARANSEATGLDVHWQQQDVFAADLSPWPVIVSNPPYVPAEDAPLLAPHVRDWEPHLALFAPAGDELAYYTHILSHARGHIFLECHSANTHVLEAWLQQHGLPYTLRTDMQGRPRMLYVNGRN